MKKILMLAAGNLSLSLGIVGIFVPVLPTTPFLLLAAACFMRSSERLYTWLVNHRILGLYVRSYILYKAISLKAKVISIIALWVVILSSALFFISLLWVRILLLVIAVGVSFYIGRIRTLTRDMLDGYEEPGQ